MKTNKPAASTLTPDRPKRQEPAIIAKGKYFLGLVSQYDGGKVNCKAYLTWELKEGEKGLLFSMCAEAWLPSMRDIFMGGQCCDEVVEMAKCPAGSLPRRMVEVWEKYHLNDMKAWTPEQEAEIERRTAEIAKTDPLILEAPHAYAMKLGYKHGHYDMACAWLKEAGLYHVPDPRDPDKAYTYGHAWLFQAIPEDVIAEIKSWPSREA